MYPPYMILCMVIPLPSTPFIQGSGQPYTHIHIHAAAPAAAAAAPPPTAAAAAAAAATQPTMASSVLNRKEASALASSVLPTPVKRRQAAQHSTTCENVIQERNA